MSTDETMPETQETLEAEAPETDTGLDTGTDGLLPEETDDTTDPEATAHEDPDPETLAHAGDADDEVLAGRLQEGRLDGHEDGRLLD